MKWTRASSRENWTLGICNGRTEPKVFIKYGNRVLTGWAFLATFKALIFGNPVRGVLHLLVYKTWSCTVHSMCVYRYCLAVRIGFLHSQTWSKIIQKLCSYFTLFKTSIENITETLRWEHKLLFKFSFYAPPPPLFSQHRTGFAKLISAL